MNKETFLEHYNELDLIVRDRLFGEKHKEYSKETDMFVNFNEAAALQNIEPAHVGINYSTKHLISIIAMLKQMFLDVTSVVVVKRFSKKYMQEKIGDMIGYLYLIYGMLNERDRRNY